MAATDPYFSLPEPYRARIRPLLAEPLASLAQLRGEVAAYLSRLEKEASGQEFVDVGTARQVADRCLNLLECLGLKPPEESHRIAQAAIRYFALEEDAEGDIHSITGFDDDLLVVQIAYRHLTGK